MILIERTYEQDNPRGGGRITYITRKAFADDDIIGIQKFLDERSTVFGYEWHELHFEYIKL